MSDAAKALTVCAGGAAIGLAVSGWNPLGAIGGCLVATITVEATGCGIINGYDGSLLSKETEKVRPLAEKLTEKARFTEEEVVTVVQWAQNNLFHYEDFGPGRHYTAAIYGDSDERFGGLNTISIDELLRERAVGCHYASGVVITMLRSIGIAAEYVRVDGHGLTYVPSIDRYIHGDHVADLVCIPAEELLQDSNELTYWAQHPGFPASELGLAPKLGMISMGFYAFQETMWKKYGYHLSLQRTENALHILGSTESANDFEQAAVLCSDYNLQLEETKNGRFAIDSDYIPIQGVNELYGGPLE